MSYTQTGIMALQTFSASPGTVTATTAVSAGDLIILGLSVGQGTAPSFTSVTDNDTGSNSYTSLVNNTDATNGNFVIIWMKVANSNYTPTFTITYSGAGSNTFSAMAVKTSSSSITPTWVSGGVGTSNSGNSSSTVMSWTPGNTNHPQEAFFVMARVNNVVTYTDPSGWGNESHLLYWNFFPYNVTSANASTGTFSGASAWDTVGVGVYDANLPVVVQVASNHGTGSQTVTLPNGVTAGNTLIAAVGSTFSPETWTLSDNVNGSWTGPINSSTSFVTANLWVFPNSAASSGANSLTLTCSEGTLAKGMFVTLMEVQGLALNPTDVSGKAHGSGATSASVSTSASTTTNPEFIVSIFQSNGAQTWTAGGNGVLQSPNSLQMMALTYTATTTATASQSVTTAANVTYDAVIAAFLTTPTLSSQTITTSFGTIGPQDSEAITAQSVTSTTGTQTPGVSVVLQSENPLVGASSPTTGGSGSASGQTLDYYTFVANRTGTANQLNCYLQSPLSATILYLALYDGGGNLLASGSCTPQAGFNTCSIPNTAITQGSTYSLAWISQGGAFNTVLFVTDTSGSNVNGTSSTTVPPPSTLPPVTVTNPIGVPSLWAAGLGGLQATFLEGSMFYQIPLVGQTATFVEGIMTVGSGGNKTIPLSQQSAGFAEGQLFDNISYLLDSGLPFTLIGQTANFTVGTIIPEVDIDASVAAFNIASTVGTVTESLSYQLGSLTGTFVEGSITASQGGGSTITLVGQQIISSNGFIGVAPTFTFPAYTAVFTEGIITFSATGDFTVSLTGQTAVFTEGLITFQSSGDEWVAREALMNAGLIPIVQYNEDPIVPPGHVISQNPTQNTVVPVNSPVIMVVSRGPMSPAGSVTMPNLIGLLWKDATDELAVSYLSQDTYLWQVNSAAAGTVIAQSVASGTNVPASTIVQLTLSAGPTKVPLTVSVPTLT